MASSPYLKALALVVMTLSMFRCTVGTCAGQDTGLLAWDFCPGLVGPGHWHEDDVMGAKFCEQDNTLYQQAPVSMSDLPSIGLIREMNDDGTTVPIQPIKIKYSRIFLNMVWESYTVQLESTGKQNVLEFDGTTYILKRIRFHTIGNFWSTEMEVHFIHEADIGPGRHTVVLVVPITAGGGGEATDEVNKFVACIPTVKEKGRLRSPVLVNPGLWLPFEEETKIHFFRGSDIQPPCGLTYWLVSKKSIVLSSGTISLMKRSIVTTNTRGQQMMEDDFTYREYKFNKDKDFTALQHPAQINPPMGMCSRCPCLTGNLNCAGFGIYSPVFSYRDYTTWLNIGTNPITMNLQTVEVVGTEAEGTQVINMCGIGMSQSPMNLSNSTTLPVMANSQLPALITTYRQSSMVAELGINALILHPRSTDDGHLVFFSKRYHLSAITFHTPGEHFVGGMNGVAEMQLKHKAMDGSQANIAVLFTLGRVNEWIRALLMGTEPEVGTRPKCFLLDVALSAEIMMPLSPNYYYYEGSDTTPPCEEGVRWFVMKQQLEISGNQLQNIATLWGNNNSRSMHPSANRMIYASVLADNNV